MRIAFILGAIASITISPQLLAQDDSVTIVSEPTEVEILAAQEKAEGVIDLVRANELEQAIRTFADGSELMKAKVQDINLLVSQANSLTTLYGPVSRCVLARFSSSSELQLTFDYVCQHQELLVQWQLRIDKLPRGWTITNLRFADAF